MLSKGKINVILGLCLTSIVSVGFSSWVISQESNPIDINGTIDVDNVINSKEYVYLDTTKGDNNTGIECFEYSDKSFLTKDGQPTNAGYLTAYFKINIAKCKEFFTPSNFNVKITLKYANDKNGAINLFASDGVNRQILSTEIVFDNISSDSVTYTTCTEEDIIKNRSFSQDFNFNKLCENVNNLEIYSFKITYKFFCITTDDYFKNTIYKTLKMDMIDFAINVQITNE